MKRLIFFALSATLIACGGDGDDKNVSFEKAKAEKTVALTSDNDSPQCKANLSVDFAKTGNAKRDSAINSTIERELFGMDNLTVKAAADSFVNQYTEDYKKSLTPLYRADRSDKNKRAWYEYKYNVTTETKAGKEGVTVYIVNIDYYEGGAHGVNIRTILNFDNATGRRLTINDVFVPGHEKRLNEMLLKALEDKTDKKGIEELKADGYLCTTDIYAPQNFILGDNGVTFVYNAYEIAPYEKGLTELTIDYDDLEELMAKDDK